MFGTGATSPYGYETDYMQYLQGYNPYNYEQTLQNMMPSAVNVNVQPDYQLSVQNSVLQPEKTTVPFSEKPEEADAKLRRMLNKIIDNVNQMNAYKESIYQPYNNTYGDTSLPMQTTDYTVSNGSFGNQVNYNLPNSMQDNSSTWDNMYNYARNKVNTIAPYIPTYYLGYGIGSIHSDLLDGYINSIGKIVELNNSYNPMRVNDKYKHAMINCLMAQRGAKSEKVSQITSGLKENYDVFMNKNTSKASDEDMEANIYGRNIGRNYPNGNCHELISTKYKP